MFIGDMNSTLVVSVNVLSCRGIEQAEKNLAKPALGISEGVNVLITTFRDGARSVACPYLTGRTSEPGEGKCAASAPKNAQLPICLFVASKVGIAYNLGEMVRERMEEKGWKQLDLARATGIDPSIISRIISGNNKSPTQKTCEKLAQALGCELSLFLPHDVPIEEGDEPSS